MKKSKIIVALLLAVVMVFSIVALAACNSGDRIELLLWAPAQAQTFYKEWADKWAENYKDSQGRQFTIKVGIMSEADAGTQVVQAPQDAADVFLFADDQLDKMITAGGIASVGATTSQAAQAIISRNSDGTVTAATRNGQLYAYPAQADNGYYLYYNDTLVTAEQAQSWEAIAAAQGGTTRVHFDFSNGWYNATWFFMYGGTFTTTETNVNGDIGMNAMKAAITFRNLFPGDRLNVGDPVQANGADGLNKGTIAAVVAGGWIYDGELKTNTHIKMTKLPTLGGKQMYTFLGSKLMGVAAYGKYLEASHALADYLTSEEVQVDKALELSAGPSNKAAAANDQVKALPTLVALAQQAEWSVPQINLPDGFWDAASAAFDKLNYTNEAWVGTPGTQEIDDALIQAVLATYIADLKLAQPAA